MTQSHINSVQPLHGIVLEVHGPAIAPAKDISYTVEWYGDDVTFQAQCAPNVQRWGIPHDPEFPLDVRAFAVGDPVDGVRINGRLYFKTREISDFGPCETLP